MIQVGQVLDKYELLERVGQGGMAIVYRGVDRDLKRVVAVKILHKHLADYKEARDRFQREAQAVAKLRHENILEIFDYSAKDGEESYIVTEFIDGQTLKEFITERPIAFPEVGAMIILQVCRALAHAHAGAILHRDVKPENIMIRSDGVVKLMDFGISHMVDLERLTVTGQLLGSPAYMAPEHVEGRPIDFRTDVFAAGIVLYQLTVGKLPFEGKNPHEVLKRIAECKFVDPRQANPRIGNRLGRIILRAMAANPDDRFAAIGEMVVALDAYLVESGLPADKIPAELARYFQAPASYEEALKARLIDTLTRSGQHKLDDDDRAAALDAFDRVLTIDPANAKVLAILDRINRRARMKSSALAVLGIVAVAGGAYLVHLKSLPPVPVAPIVDITPPQQNPQQLVAHDDPPPKPKPDDVAVIPGDAGVVAMLRDASVPDATLAVEPVAVPVDIRVLAGSEYRIGTDPWRPVNGQKLTVAVLDHPIDVDIRRPGLTEDVTLHVDGTIKVVDAHQQFLPAQLVFHCAVPVTSVDVDNKPVGLDESLNVLFDHDAFSSTKTMTVTFYGKRGAPDVQKITVEAGKQQDVKCALH